jgi:hypothetical protein
MLRATALVIRILDWLNWAVGIAFAILLAASVLAEPRFLEALAPRYGARSGVLLGDMRMVLIIALAMAPAAWLLFNRLLAILASVGAGDAFVAANGRRLRTIGWALLAIQTLDLFYGGIAAGITARSGEYLGWSPSLGGWIAVLLVFVLAQVWTQGAAMRDELDATV